MYDLINKIEFQYKVYDTLNNLISTSDNKATISLSIQTFLISSILGASILSKTILDTIVFNVFGISITINVLLLFFTISSILGIVCALLVYLPRKTHEANEYIREGLTYYIHISKYKNSSEYSNKIFKISDQDILTEFNHQNYNLAHIVRKKMAYIKRTIYFLFFNIIVALLIAFLISLNI